MNVNRVLGCAFRRFVYEVTLGELSLKIAGILAKISDRHGFTLDS